MANQSSEKEEIQVVRVPSSEIMKYIKEADYDIDFGGVTFKPDVRELSKSGVNGSTDTTSSSSSSGVQSSKTEFVADGITYILDMLNNSIFTIELKDSREKDKSDKTQKDEAQKDKEHEDRGN